MARVSELAKENGRKYSRAYYHRKKSQVLAKLHRRRSTPEDREKQFQKRLKYDLKYKYGITHEEYDQLYNEFNGSCHCCGKHQSEEGRRLQIDHDHVTGKVRGLLCWDCNIGIGKLKDSYEGVKQALVYMERHYGAQ